MFVQFALIMLIILRIRALPYYKIGKPYVFGVHRSEVKGKKMKIL